MKAPTSLCSTGLVDVEEIGTNPSSNPRFMDIVNVRMSRRQMFRVSGSTAAAAMMSGFGLSACGSSGDGGSAAAAPGTVSTSTTVSALSFGAVSKSLIDRIVVPTGYTARVIYKAGDPIAAGVAAYGNVGNDDPATFTNRSGDNHDGIELFALNDAGTAPDRSGVNRAVLAMNHEYVNQLFLHAAGPTNMASGTDSPRPQNEVDREVAMHGVSVVEVAKLNTAGAFDPTGAWGVVQASSFNRRVTAATEMDLSGPARGHPTMVTRFSSAGTATRGTFNNCGTGYTPWGTLLTCEENWAGYLYRPTTDNAARSAKEVASFNRYGIGVGARKGFNNDRYGWATVTAATPAQQDLYDRWNAGIRNATASDDYRNVANTFGWVVEVDPYTRTSRPKKRTALGRFAHEAAVTTTAQAGRPLAFYMGDDSRGDYIYKFVSRQVWSAADANATNRLAVGDKYLDEGTLFVARFNADGTGTWLQADITNSVIASSTAYAFADQVDVLSNARFAGDALRGTQMDRPEWGAVNPLTNEIYFTLTEANSSSGRTGRRADNVDGANPRFFSDTRGALPGGGPAATISGNPFGHIIRMAEDGNNPASTTFRWDVYLFGAQADADSNRVNLSGLSTANDFARPDGLWFSPTTGIAWIQTDDSGAFLDQTNCMMLAGVPGSVGDGRVVMLSYDVPASGSTPASTRTVNARVGRAVTETTLKRFLVGPLDCEITGVTETPDGRTMFVNIQHPGEDTPSSNIGDPARYTSYWPLAERNPAAAGNATGPRPLSATIVITKNDGGLIGS